MSLADLILGKRTDDSESYRGAPVIRSAESPMLVGLLKIENVELRQIAIDKVVASAK